MTEHAPTAPDVRNGRGTPPGRGVAVVRGGLIGNPPFVPTDEQRAKVRQYAKAFPVSGERHIAKLIGVSRNTLRNHFSHELELGRAEMLAALGSQMVSRALDADAQGADRTPIAKGDLDAQKFVLARLGGWSTKVEHSGPDGGPIETKTFDLSNLSVEQLEAMLPVIDQILAAAGAEEAEFTEVDAEGEGDATSDAD